ncbi:hypothetical protein OROHE_005985 [Orobanche hederae]
MKKRVARILFSKIRPSREILKIRDGTPLEAEEILTYIKSPRNGSVCYFSSKLDVPSNIVQKKRATRILFSKIRPSREILHKKALETDRLQKKRVARILFSKIRPSREILKIRDGTPLEMPSREILKIRDGTPLEAEEILTYIKSPRNGSVCYFSSKLDVPSNIVQKKRATRILFSKIRPSREILHKKALETDRPSREILKIHDGTPLEAEEILTYIKIPRNGSKKRVARILFSKIRPSREILKIRDGTPLEAEEILTYIKKLSKRIVQKKRVARILFSKIRPSREILKIRDGTPLEAEEILTYIKSPRNGSVCYFSSKLDVPSNIVQKKRATRILFSKIRPSREILHKKALETDRGGGILTYIESPRNGSVYYFSSKLDVPCNVVQKKRVARILFSKIRPSREILKIRDGTPLEAEEILTYIKSPRNGSVCYFSSKLDVPSNIVQKKRATPILFSKIRPSREILHKKALETDRGGGILTYIESPRNGSVYYFSSKLDVPCNVVQKKRVARILFSKIRPSREILKIRDGTPLEAEEILTYIKSPRNGSVCYFSSKLDVPSNIVQKKRATPILFSKIRPSREILHKKALETDRFVTFLAS